MASKISVPVGMYKPQLPFATTMPAPYPQIPKAGIYDHRGSISTDRTSASMEESEENVPTTRVRNPIRAKGIYRLSDFIIQRTLGTGSFGRVHLGM